MAADQDQVLRLCKFPCFFLRIGGACRAEDDGVFRFPGISVFAGTQGVDNRLAAHHHTGAAAKRRIINMAETPRGIGPDIYDLHFEGFFSDRPGDNGALQKTPEQFGHHAEYRYSHFFH